MNDQSDSSSPSPPRPAKGGADSSLFQSLRARMRQWRRSGRNGEDSLRDALDELIEEHEDEDFSFGDHERLLLANILKLRDVTAYDIMIPRADIAAVDIDTPLPEVTKLMAERGHSRLPVYRESLDDVAGMVHIKDLLGVIGRGRGSRIAPLLRPLMFVSPSMRVLDLLLEMRLKRVHMALVVDEYGGIDGLVTIEDLVEQIVGEIADEHDVEAEPEIMPNRDGTWTADARIDLDDFEELVGKVLTEEEREDVDTLGGLVFHIADRVPRRGEVIRHSSGLEFEILDADPRRIKKLKILNLPSPSDAESAAE